MAYIRKMQIRNIVVTGWNRHVFVFKDALEGVSKSSAPINKHWDQAKGHQADIVASSLLPPNTLITADSAGQVRYLFVSCGEDRAGVMVWCFAHGVSPGPGLRH